MCASFLQKGAAFNKLVALSRFLYPYDFYKENSKQNYA